MRVHAFALFLCHKQDTAPVISTISIGHKSESDAQVQQQEVLGSLQQQVEQLSNDVDQMTADIKQISVTYTQVIHMQNWRHDINIKWIFSFGFGSHCMW